MNETFISYSRKDKEFVRAIIQSLQETGIDLWLDESDIPAASKWKQEILVGIQFAHNFIYVISPDSVESEYCNLELDYALSLNKRIIPIVCRLCRDIRPAISELNWIFFDDFSEGIESLLELLDSPLGTTFGNRIDSQIRITDKLGQRTFPLYRNQYRIGRNPSAEFSEAGLFRLGDESVSRTHATLLRKEGRWLVIDGLILFNERGKPISYNKSRNGLLVKRLSEKGRLLSSEPLRPMQLRPLSNGDVVQLTSDTSFIYEEISPENQFRMIESDDRDTLVNG
jgi:hypothetical protein